MSAYPDEMEDSLTEVSGAVEDPSVKPVCTVCKLQIFGKFYSRLGVVAGVQHFAHRNCAVTAEGRGAMKKLRAEEEARLEAELQAQRNAVPTTAPSPYPTDEMENVPVVAPEPKKEHWLAPSPYGDDDE